ncbi:hypothetical protein [Hyalangium rubrum]|uniref:Uncharacterized protein n=1 Tax=Hyalangium rubrum TaxID=3103134 RepID=A0ABU5H847_9BACT|nr:hypothetical protein [Hyalangium sp. s54d21]MDY7228942.1 hypothetical protein [Hyalangium sp. s54d21]
MEPRQPLSLSMPAFLHGRYLAVERQARAEGLRSGEHYRRTGAFPAPLEVQDLPPGELVVAHDVVDFQRERPAWRLYMVSSVLDGVYETLEWQNPLPVKRAYEASCRETAWGALYFAISRTAPKSAERTALLLQAVLRFWDVLQSARYLFSAPGATLTLDELMLTACDWAMDAWAPKPGASVRSRLEAASERMARATREDSIDAILRQLPRALSFAQGLKHRNVLESPALLREHLTTLDPNSFERVSGACTSDLLELLYGWDQELGMQ